MHQPSVKDGDIVPLEKQATSCAEASALGFSSARDHQPTGLNDAVSEKRSK